MSQSSQSYLTYYIFEGLLIGVVNGANFHIFALSGGGGGTSRKSGPVEPGTVNNPYRTGQKENAASGLRGGPIPPGRYNIAKPGPFHHGRGARLTPIHPREFSKATGGRGGFWIHGRGPLGSDGCIVPLVPAQFQALMDALENAKGGTLTVLEAMGGGGFA